MISANFFDFRMDAWTPDTLPMVRLAEYLARLATLFGNQEQVYFLKVRKGSAVSEIHVHETVASKVQARLQLVSAGNGPEDAACAGSQWNVFDDPQAELKKLREG